jgi:3-keto-disaccharide hydrolase
MRNAVVHAAAALALGAGLAGSGFAQKQDAPQPPYVDPGGPGKPPADAVALFDDKDLSGWTNRDGKPAGCAARDGAMVCVSGSGDVYSKETFRDAQIHLEFNVPLMPEQKSQMRGNSGVYLQGRYEIQILDSFENPTYADGSCAAVYGQAPPLVNACRRPGEWQTYDIIFHGARCGADGKLHKHATVTVVHNGVLVQDHVEIQNTLKGCAESRIGEPGPLMLQDHSGFPNAPRTEMRFRNIWLRHLKESH